MSFSLITELYIIKQQIRTILSYWQKEGSVLLTLMSKVKRGFEIT